MVSEPGCFSVNTDEAGESTESKNHGWFIDSQFYFLEKSQDQGISYWFTDSQVLQVFCWKDL